MVMHKNKSKKNSLNLQQLQSIMLLKSLRIGIQQDKILFIGDSITYGGSYIDDKKYFHI